MPVTGVITGTVIDASGNPLVGARGSYLATAIDVAPYRLTGDADLMERARAAAVPIEIREGRIPVTLRLVRLQPFVQGPEK